MRPFTDHLLAISWLLHAEHQTKLQEQGDVMKFHSWQAVGDECALPELGAASREAILIFFVWWIGGVWQKSKIAYDNCLTRGFLDHFWYGESISELHLASIPWEHLHFASRVGDFRPVEVLFGEPKRDWSRQNHMKWTSEMNSPSQNYSRTSWVWLLRSWLSTSTAIPAFHKKFGRVPPVNGISRSTSNPVSRDDVHVSNAKF